MNRKKILILLLPLLIWTQCNTFGQSSSPIKYSEYVLQNLDKYQAFGEFLTENTNALIKHNLNIRPTHIFEGRKKDYCYSWSFPYALENLDNVPAFLQNDFIEKVRRIDEKHLTIVNICLDKSVEFFVASDYEVSGGGYDFFFLIHILEYRSVGIEVPYKYPSLGDSFVHASFNYGIARVED